MIYFSDDELRCKGSGVILLAEGFAHKLDEFREHFGRPMYVNSGCRSYAHNISVGGHPNSSHIYDHPDRQFKGSYAVDIRCTNGADRAEMVKAGLLLGWSIGINKTFVHFDRRTDYFPEMKQTIFLY